MATGDLLSDDDIDVMLRDLLDEGQATQDWQSAQRRSLMIHIEGSSASHNDDISVAFHSPNLPVQLRTEPLRSGNTRVLVGAAAATVIALGTFGFMRLGSSEPFDQPASTDVPASASSGTLTNGRSDSGSVRWPALLPSVSPSSGETIVAGVNATSEGNPMMTTAVFAKVEGASVSDIVHLSAVVTDDYVDLVNGFFGEVSIETEVGGVVVRTWEPPEDGAFATPVVVVPFDTDYSLVISGSNPGEFLELAGPRFASIGTTEEGVLSLTFQSMPAGYEQLASPQALLPGTMNPFISIRNADGSVAFDVASASGPDAFVFAFAAQRDLVRTEDGRYWMSDSKFGAQLVWQIGAGEWLVMSNIFGQVDGSPADLDEALVIANRIELVDVDTWLARYPDAIDGGVPATTLAPEDLEAAPAATEEVPVVDNTPGARVLVANASYVAGVAGMLTVQLDADFRVLPAVNSGEQSFRDRSAVYYQPGFIDAATALADRIGGADVLPMPDELPIDGGNDALLGPDIVDGHGSIDILVMLANDHAREIQDLAGP